MKIITFIFAALSLFVCTHAYASEVEKLITTLNASMAEANDFRNSFPSDLAISLYKELNVTKEYLSLSLARIIQFAYLKVEEAKKNGVDASDCVKDLQSDLNTVISDYTLPGLEKCIQQTQKLSGDYASLVGNHGNTGYVMIEGLKELIKNYDTLPSEDAGKCYIGLNFYVNAVSSNYASTTDRFIREGNQFLINLKDNLINCFQRPIDNTGLKLLTIDKGVQTCIKEKENTAS